MKKVKKVKLCAKNKVQIMSDLKLLVMLLSLTMILLRGADQRVTPLCANLFSRPLTEVVAVGILKNLLQASENSPESF